MKSFYSSFWCSNTFIHVSTLFYEQSICRSFHLLLSGRHYLQQINVPVEVRSPAGNFDTLGKKFVVGFWTAKSKFWVWRFIYFIFTVNFFTKESPSRNIEKKNIFRENPVEVRSFDGTRLVKKPYVYRRYVMLYEHYTLVNISSTALSDVTLLFRWIKMM